MKKVLLDCDGVTYDLLGHTLQALHLLSPSRESFAAKLKRLKNYCFKQDLDPYDQALLYPIWSLPGFAHNIPLTSLGLKLQGLDYRKYAFEFVTKPYHSNTWISDRRLAIARDFDKTIPVHFAEDKSEFDGDIFVEDKLSNLLDWMEKHPNGFGILVSTCYTTTQFAEEGIDMNNFFGFKTPFSVFSPKRNFYITNKNFSLMLNTHVYNALYHLSK